MLESIFRNVILDTLKDGKTIPSEVMVKLIQEGMESSGSSRFLIEGFPRSEDNRKTFEQIVKKEVDMVLLFDCPEEEMIRRVQFSDEGGISEHTDSIKKRINVFKITSAPIIDYYTKKGILHKINVRINEDEDGSIRTSSPSFYLLQGNYEKLTVPVKGHEQYDITIHVVP
ncbi:hypothetical protein K2173_008514 [Erythroxylum novogranatense]|uniref:adenylate kinase n=1 Tax=Erythroxylum novogranatense TaxID=1862640 RepID=A0AAV8SL98_9ROSI|nr:hypothetical protein K2173_008514 [Erythroxylum novogranatense]